MPAIEPAGAPPHRSLQTTLTRRSLNFAGLLCCVGLLGYAWYAQGVLKVDPCPLCIFQRIGVAAVGALFLMAWLHSPKAFGARIYGVLLAGAALLTMAVAARHVWIQHLPADAVPACGATLNYMLDVFPLTDVIRKVLTGSGECHQVNWSFLTLAMPTWVLIAAAALGALGVYANWVTPRR
jgi:protein dithiol:quinone oxidoreductase